MELYKRSKWAAIPMVQFLIFFKTILSQNFSSPLKVLFIYSLNTSFGKILKTFHPR